MVPSRSPRYSWIACAGLGVLAVAFPALAAEPAVSGVLGDYVRRDDPSYGWTIRRQGTAAGCDYVELILTSQTWRETAWKHQLYLIKPTGPIDDSHQGLLFISGGRWRDAYVEPPAPDEGLPDEALLFLGLARQLRSVVAVVRQVPHQPLFGDLYEDQIIAYTFEKYLETGDPQWPLLLPMVKSAVRAMDAATEVARREWNYELRTFTVTGASKRGWTTWLTGAVDPRATAIAPMVIDVLNMSEQIKHQRDVWGELSSEIADYSERGLTEDLQSDAAQALRAIVDPYSYRSVLTQPKLLLIGTNDRYWTIDALNLYWDDLQPEKYVLYVPNNGHDLRDVGRITGALNALHQHAARGFPMPRITWQYTNREEGLELTVTSDPAPTGARVWLARSVDRDFRDEAWTAEPLEGSGDGEYRFRLAAVDAPQVALFGELDFVCHGIPFSLSTNVRVTSGADQPAAPAGK